MQESETIPDNIISITEHQAEYCQTEGNPSYFSPQQKAFPVHIEFSFYGSAGI